MKDTLTYKGFIGSVHFSADDKVFHGRIVDIKDLVTFEGDNVSELIKAFYDAVDDYLDLCKEAGKEPLKLHKGSFNVRVSSQLHSRAITVAAMRRITLNKLVQTAVEHEVEGKHCYMESFKTPAKRKTGKRTE